MAPVTFIQSADAVVYRPMLECTAQTVVAYCRRWNCDYQSFIGRKRGFLPWHATFNRILQLSDLVRSGLRGWVFHLDADAFVHDLTFDVRAYLADKRDRAAILVPSGATSAAWDVNVGVAAFNLGHPVGRSLIARWRTRLDLLGDADFAGMTDWSVGWNDQNMLHWVLEHNPRWLDRIHFERPDLLNSFYARFIRQLMRDHAPALSYRMSLIRDAVAQVMADAEPAPTPAPAMSGEATALEDSILAALCRVLAPHPPGDDDRRHLRMLLRSQALEQGVEAVARDLLARRGEALAAA